MIQFNQQTKSFSKGDKSNWIFFSIYWIDPCFSTKVDFSKLTPEKFFGALTCQSFYIFIAILVIAHT